MLRFPTAHPEEYVKPILQPWQLLLLILAGWVNRRQQDVIEYLLAENRVLRQKRGEKRISLNDDQRRRLAVKGEILVRANPEPDSKSCASFFTLRLLKSGESMYAQVIRL